LSKRATKGDAVSTIEETRGGKTVEEREVSALELLREHGSVVGRRRTLVIPDPPEGATKFYSTRPRERSTIVLNIDADTVELESSSTSYPHGRNTFLSLAALALDSSVVLHEEHKIGGTVEAIEDRFSLAPGARRG
jgi:hypothetical protein